MPLILIQIFQNIGSIIAFHKYIKSESLKITIIKYTALIFLISIVGGIYFIYTDIKNKYLRQQYFVNIEISEKEQQLYDLLKKGAFTCGLNYFFGWAQIDEYYVIIKVVYTHLGLETITTPFGTTKVEVYRNILDDQCSVVKTALFKEYGLMPFCKKRPLDNQSKQYINSLREFEVSMMTQPDALKMNLDLFLGLYRDSILKAHSTMLTPLKMNDKTIAIIYVSWTDQADRTKCTDAVLRQVIADSALEIKTLFVES